MTEETLNPSKSSTIREQPTKFFHIFDWCPVSVSTWYSVEKFNGENYLTSSIADTEYRDMAKGVCVDKKDLKNYNCL